MPVAILLLAVTHAARDSQTLGIMARRNAKSTTSKAPKAKKPRASAKEKKASAELSRRVAASRNAAKDGDADDALASDVEEKLGDFKKRRLNRRDSDEKAHRAVKRRMWPIYGQDVCENARNSAGMSLQGRVREEYRKSTGYVKKPFWPSLVAEFKLSVESIVFEAPRGSASLCGKRCTTL